MTILNFLECVIVISSDPPWTLHVKMAMSDSQRHHTKKHLCVNVEETVVFLTRNFFSLSFSIVFFIKKKTANENDPFKETQTLISNSYLIRQSF